MSSPKFYGKFRAKVTDIDDPDKRGRIRVECPKILGKDKSHWCEVCSPVAYENGGDFCLPKKDDTVWIEFEDGDPDKPIYSGSWWSNNNCIADDDKDEYNDSTRIIEFDGCKIKMKSDESIETTIKNSKIFMEKDDTYIQVGNKVEAKLKSDKITLKVGGSFIEITEDSITVKSAKIDLNP